MSSCYDGSFLCQNPAYEFDRLASQELKNPPTAEEIISHSEFCAFVPLDEAMQLGNLTHKDYLKGLNSKVGLYQMWINHENCTDHDTYTMLCVYVGKGMAESRMLQHIKNKWPNVTELYVTFYECSNRMAKYLEQLFMDIYNFHLNDNENPGIEQLFAVWDQERHFMGTEMQAVSDRAGFESFEDLDAIEAKNKKLRK
jgi:hypothetical protein